MFDGIKLVRFIIFALLLNGIPGTFGGFRYNKLRNSIQETIHLTEKREDNKEKVPVTDSDGKYTGGFNSDCSEAHVLTQTHKTVKVEASDELLAKENVRCHWNIIGTQDCIPVVQCRKFKLKPTPTASKEPCPKEYFEITDGNSGYQRFCSDDGPKNIFPTNGTRDLYITFQGSISKKIPGRGFKCTVTCQTGQEANATALEENFDPVKNEYCTCGRKPNTNRIVGGVDARKGEFPWIVALVTANTRRPYCGGTIINDRFILTAAHCFKGPYVKLKNFQVLAHGFDLDLTTTEGTAGEEDTGKNQMTPEQEAKLKASDAEDNSVRLDPEEYFIHPLYVRQTNDYDVGLIKLKNKIDFSVYKFLQPACMPELSDLNKTYDNVDAVVAGWGLNAADAHSTMRTLQKLNVTVIPNAECKSLYDERFSKRMMCAAGYNYKAGGQDSCKGDSGGPLIATKSTHIWQIIGTVSWGEGCAAKSLPGVYQRVTEMNQWIRYISNMEDAMWCRE